MDILLDNKLLNITFNNLFEKDRLINQFDTFYNLNTFNQPLSIQLWTVSLISACLVGIVGLIPLFFISFTMKCISSEKNGIYFLNLILIYLINQFLNYSIIILLRI